MEQKFCIRVSPQFCIFSACMLLAVPFLWFAGWVTAVTIHELFHYLMLRLCCADIKCISLELYGAVIYTEDLSPRNTFLCAIAGPFGGFTLLAFSEWFPQAAIWTMILSVYNLLPIYPLDGGQALRGLIGMFFNERQTEKASYAVECVVILSLFVIGFLALFIWNLSLLPLFFAVLTALRFRKIKRPCKSIPNAVQ